MAEGHIWNQMSIEERKKMLEEAGYKPETIAEYSTKKWSEIKRDYRPGFARIVAINRGERPVLPPWS